MFCKVVARMRGVDVMALAFLAACAADDGGGPNGSGSGGVGTGGNATGSGGAVAGHSGSMATGGQGGVGGAGHSGAGGAGASGSGASGSGGAGAGGAGGAGAGGSGGSMAMIDAGPPPDPTVPPDPPTPKGTCPEFKQGNVMFGDRETVISMSSAAQSMSGPLIIYWYATGGSPIEAQRGLPVDDITAEGGIVVAPVDVPEAGTFPWLSQLDQHDALFDEILGCAAQKTKIDTKRVHALGWSAGGLMTTHLSFSRSKYMASVVTYSGGAMGMFQEMDNKFAAMIFAGGPGDQLVLDFYSSSMAWQGVLKSAGHFAMFCDWGGGHAIPTQYVPAAWQFFKDHPYGTVPSPYAGHIPQGIASVCTE
jgi:hypothetical protein